VNVDDDNETSGAIEFEDRSGEQPAEVERANGHAGVHPTTQVARGVRWTSYYVDVAWIDQGVAVFDCAVPGPALFKRAVRVMRESRLFGPNGETSERVPKLRLLFFVNPDSPPIPCRFVIARNKVGDGDEFGEAACAIVPEGSTTPFVPRDIAVAENGDPIAIFQIQGFAPPSWQPTVVDLGGGVAASEVTPTE
jgi:hypothetical protein